MLLFALACIADPSGLTVEDLQIDVSGSLVRVAWSQIGDGDPLIRFRVVGEDWRTAPAVDRAAGAQEQWLPGLPFDVEVEVEVEGIGASAITEAAGLVPPDFTVSGADGAWDETAPFVLLSTEGADGRMASFLVDRQGRVVWERAAANRATTLHARQSADGRSLLLDDNTFWTVFDGGSASTISRHDLFGELEVIDTPGLHHPFTELPDGSLAWSAISGLDALIVVRSPQGETSTVWSCQDFVEEQGASAAECGANTLWYDEKTGHFLYSLYSLETVVEIDASTGESLRWFGHFSGAWDFEGAPFWWQHGAYYTDAGTLLVSSKDEQQARETVVREYTLDEESQTLVLAWEAGVGGGAFGEVMGEAHRLPSGNTLHNLGSATLIREYDTAGEVVWELSWEGSTLGRSEPIEDLFALLPDR